MFANLIINFILVIFFNIEKSLFILYYINSYIKTGKEPIIILIKYF